MKLSDWLRMADINLAVPFEQGQAVQLVVEPDFSGKFADMYAELWRLEDYAVSTVSGPVLWLMPKVRPDAGR